MLFSVLQVSLSRSTSISFQLRQQLYSLHSTRPKIQSSIASSLGSLFWMLQHLLYLPCSVKWVDRVLMQLIFEACKLSNYIAKLCVKVAKWSQLPKERHYLVSSILLPTFMTTSFFCAIGIVCPLECFQPTNISISDMALLGLQIYSSK